MNRGNLHDYLGIDLYYTEKMIVKVSMIQYLKIVLREFPEHLVTSELLPDADHLFKARPDIKAKYLTKEKAGVLHHTVSQLIFYVVTIQT